MTQIKQMKPSSQPANTSTYKDQIRNKLKQHYNNNLVRARLKFISKQDINQKSKLNFSSNDYLGFACDQEIITKTQELLPTIGIGSGASNMVSGYHHIHQDLENYLSDFLKCDQVVLFPSGFMANLAIADTLLNIDKENTIAISDHNNHASILDGFRLANCKYARYKHNDLDHLNLILNKHNDYLYKFIFTESLFSMDGDQTDLKKIYKTTLNINNNIDSDVTDNNTFIIDESHAFGIYNNGRGLSFEPNRSNPINNSKITMGTFGKAIGTAGAFVAGPKIFIESLIQFARPYIYTTSLSPAIAAATLYSLRLNESTTEFRDKLFNNIKYFCDNLHKAGFSSANNNSPIQPIIIGDSKLCLKAAEYLQKKNIIITAIRTPSVQENKARLRITLSAKHSHTNIDYLIRCLKDLKHEYL